MQLKKTKTQTSSLVFDKYRLSGVNTFGESLKLIFSADKSINYLYISQILCLCRFPKGLEIIYSIYTMGK